MWYMVGNLGYVETTNIPMYLHYTIPHLLATCKDSDSGLMFFSLAIGPYISIHIGIQVFTCSKQMSYYVIPRLYILPIYFL